MKKLAVFLILFALVHGIVGISNATLIDRGGGLIYDSELDVTWLQDAGMSCGQIVPCNWDNAMTWAANLSYYDSARGIFWDEWRLPRGYISQDDADDGMGYNVGEMGHLFYDELGNTFRDRTTYNAGPFVNLNYGAVFWTSTEFRALGALVYDFWGYQHQYSKINTWRAWAVMDGDVYHAPVPEPATILLLGFGIVGLAGARRKFKKR